MTRPDVKIKKLTNHVFDPTLQQRNGQENSSQTARHFQKDNEYMRTAWIHSQTSSQTPERYQWIHNKVQCLCLLSCF